MSSRLNSPISLACNAAKRTGQRASEAAGDGSMECQNRRRLVALGMPCWQSRQVCAPAGQREAQLWRFRTGGAWWRGGPCPGARWAPPLPLWGRPPPAARRHLSCPAVYHSHSYPYFMNTPPLGYHSTCNKKAFNLSFAITDSYKGHESMTPAVALTARPYRHAPQFRLRLCHGWVRCFSDSSPATHCLCMPGRVRPAHLPRMQRLPARQRW